MSVPYSVRSCRFPSSLVYMYDTGTILPLHGFDATTQGDRLLHRWPALRWLFGPLLKSLGCLILFYSCAASPVLAFQYSKMTFAGGAAFGWNRAVNFSKPNGGYLEWKNNGVWVSLSWNGWYVNGTTPTAIPSMGPVQFGSTSKDFIYRWAGQTQEYTLNVPVAPYTVVATLSSYQDTSTIQLPPFEVALNYGTGEQVVTSTQEGDIPPSFVNPLLALAGQNVTVPYYVEGDAETVSLVVGDQTYTFPVDVVEGDSGGLATLSFKIPANWNGSATINGAAVDLAPKLAYTGTPALGFWANPYSAELPKGMVAGIPGLPAGVSASQFYNLPSTITAGQGLTMPTGITAVGSAPAAVAGSLPVSVTNSAGVRTWTTASASTVTTGTTTTISKGVADGGHTTGTDAGDLGALDAVVGGEFGKADDSEKVGAAMGGLADRWEVLKSSVQGKFGDFKPLASGSIPTASSLSFTLDFASFGSRNVTFDFTGQPFTTARALALVFVVFWAGMYFLRFLRV